MLRAIRILCEMVGRNVVDDAPLHEDEEFLAERIERADVKSSPRCAALLGELPDGVDVERVHDDRFAGGSVLIVDREGRDWVTLPSSVATPRFKADGLSNHR